MINTRILKESASNIGVSLDNIALERFDKYAEHLVETNKSMNLTAIVEPDEIISKHFVDSLSLLTAIDIKKNSSLIDVGTGAGFPGLALLIARPDLKVTLMDGTNKRLTFISEVLSQIGLSADVVHSRAEIAGKDKKYREKYDVVTARAVADMTLLSEYCLPFTKVGGIFAPMKATKTDEELKKSYTAFDLLGGKVEEIKHLNISNCGERCIIIVKKISQTPSKYPRASAQIAKKPLV